MEKYKSRINTPKDMLDESYEVTLEISSLHYFSWLILAKQAIERESFYRVDLSELDT